MTEKEQKRQLSTMTQSPLSAYHKTEVMTANKETILLMLYSGAIRFLKRAISAAEKSNIEEKTLFIGKVQAIITELRSTLDFTVGKDIALQLDAIYTYINQKMAESITQNNFEQLKEVLSILTTLNEGWEAAIATLRRERSLKTNIEE